MNHAIINGTGSYLPKRQVFNSELESKLDTSDEWIISRTGIQSRHIASEEETTSFMAAKAAAKALEAAQLVANDIDLIITATCTPDHVFPSVACYVQHALAITRPIPAFDISAACSGFVYALDIAHQYIKAGNINHILVIGSECMSGAVDWSDRASCVLFGDGAGAAILSASKEPGILGSALHAAFDENRLLTYPTQTTSAEKAVISMRGNEVFKLAVNIMGDIVDEVLAISGLNQQDVTWLVPHQANIRIIQAIAKKLSMPMTQVIVTLAHQGNTSAASIPLALDVSIRNKQIKRGDVLLLESFGGGMTWGAMALRY